MPLVDQTFEPGKLFEHSLVQSIRLFVQVRDFKRKKTVSVKAGHSYLAGAARKKR